MPFLLLTVAEKAATAEAQPVGKTPGLSDFITEVLIRLQAISFNLGGNQITLLGVLTGLLTLCVALLVANLLSRALDARINRVRVWSPSMRVLVCKVVHVSLYTLAVLLALDTVGINVASLAVFGGALGLGIGFGLQKVVSNLVSGFILLTDRSIKPGDVIQIEGTYGWINNLRARYVSVITRDGTEHLIPNEDLITQRVINWSFTNKNVRLKLPVGVSYRCDIHRARELMLEACRNVERVMEDPPPMCQLVGFGDNSVDFELRIWINDPPNGVANVKSEVYFKVWDAFREHGIEIPFPQRDVHLDAHPSVIEALQGKDRGDKPPTG